jgi:hypothetical protein
LDLGVFPFEELRRRREAGEFNGSEYVQYEGTDDWQPLDLVLREGRRVTPPPLPPIAARNEPNQTLIWTAVVGGVVLIVFVLVVIGILATKFQRGIVSTINETPRNRGLNQPNPQAVAAASKPIVWTNSTQTARDSQKRERAFRTRQWLEGYEKRGLHNPECDAEAELFLKIYIARNYSGAEATNTLSLGDESDKLANDPNCQDPLVLTIAADESLNQFDAIHRFDRALAAYPHSQHRAYPQFYATIRLIRELNNQSDRVGGLQTSALQLLKTCFADGSFTAADQQEIADLFINGWGYAFFEQNAAAVCNLAHTAGPDYQWLALTLDGEHEIIDAWAARGGGYSDSVSDAGWQGFNSHLASARSDLTAAWNLHPDWPIAPARMIYVSLGDSDIQEMRTWFDRTTMAQIDYPRAWSDLRWGLRPRWYGNEEAMLSLGVSGINSGRFDTDVPRKYLDCLYDVESEMGLPVGRHIYGHADVWPNLKRMYEGYINAASQKENRDSWRSEYAVVAYLARKYDVARTQLEALDWKPQPKNTTGWNVDLSLMPLEVAARTGPLGKKITSAELARNADDISGALKLYTELKAMPEADERTEEFIQCRMAELSDEKRLKDGDWVSLLPTRDDDPNWVVSFGKIHVLPDGALEVESGPKGHMLYSQVRPGENFEVRGQFEVVHSANKNFQGGLVMGMPDFDGYEWYGFRLKRHDEEGDVTCFAQGWTREQIVHNSVLNDVTNSFDFILQDGCVTASVNGVKVFDKAVAPAQIDIPEDSFMIGLGAFNDSPDTIIRYRNVQLKKL